MIKGIIFDWIGTLYKRNEDLFPCSEKVLRKLKKKGYKLGLISLAAQGVEKRRKELDESGITDYFDLIIVDTSKEPSHYLKCMEEMGTNLENTLIVDDRTLRGIKIGNSLGCKTCWIQKGDYSHEEPDEETGEPTYKIDSVKDLLKFL